MEDRRTAGHTWRSKTPLLIDLRPCNASLISELVTVASGSWSNLVKSDRASVSRVTCADGDTAERIACRRFLRASAIGTASRAHHGRQLSAAVQHSRSYDCQAPPVRFRREAVQ